MDVFYEKEMAKERTLQETPTWAVAVVCFVLLAVSIIIEHIIHAIGHWCKKKQKPALYEAVEKIKGELMLLGFLSFMLTVFQDHIAKICISRKVANSWRPCPYYKDEFEKSSKTKSPNNPRNLLQHMMMNNIPSLLPQRRSLATKGYDQCGKDQVAFVSAYGIHQLHIFIFWLAIFHILQCILTLALGTTKMRRWKKWEEETKTVEYQFYNDPERFRFTRDTTFGRRHLSIWSQSNISLWIISFFRQFYGSVTRVDYLALRHGFVMAHLAPGSEARFDFRKYIQRSLDEDFKVVVGISPIIWFSAVLFLLANVDGWYPYFWLPFIPLLIILLVGAKLQMIITQMGLRIQERGEVVKGAPLVEPDDHLFWFNRPRFLLHLIHFVLFQNAFQLAFFAWSTYEFKIDSCFHHGRPLVDVMVRITTGVIVQVLCSYVTLPLYALVTQMGSNMKHTIFNERVATALKSWHHTAKKHVKEGKHSEANTPFSSAPATPTHGMSPVHLLHKHRGGLSDSVQNSPRASLSLHENENDRWDLEEGPPYPTTNDHPTLQILDDHDDHEIQMMQVGGGPDGPEEFPTGSRPVETGISSFSFKNNRHLR